MTNTSLDKLHRTKPAIMVGRGGLHPGCSAVNCFIRYPPTRLGGRWDVGLLPGRLLPVDATSCHQHHRSPAPPSRPSPPRTMPNMRIINDTAPPQLPELSVFRTKVNSVSDKANVNMKWLVLSLLKLAEDEETMSQDEKLRKVLAKLFEPQPTNKMSTVSLARLLLIPVARC